MDIENVVTLFCTLSKQASGDRAKFFDIINGAYLSVVSRLKKDVTQYTDDETDELEYACACIAYYDFTVISLTRESRVVTETGSYKFDYTADMRIKAAALLKNMAIKNIAGLITDDEFLFASI